MNQQFKVLGLISIPDEHVPLVLNVTSILAVMYLVDFFTDWNYPKSLYKSLTKATPVPASTPTV